MASPTRTAIPGSEQIPLPGARLLGPVDPQEPVEVTLRVRPRSPEPRKEELEVLGSEPTEQHQYPSREEYAARYGADPLDLKKVEEFAHAHGLVVKDVRAGERSVVLAGPAQAMNEAFGVVLSRYETESGSYRGTTGPVHVPVDLASVIKAVVGLDSRPHAKPLDP